MTGTIPPLPQRSITTPFDALLRAATNRLITRYAQQRGFLAPVRYPPDELAHLRAQVQAETASRELLQAVLEPRATPNGASLGVQIKALMTMVQTIVQHSTPAGEEPPQMTVGYRYVDLPHSPARLLRDGALLLVLCALDDGALAIRVSLERDETCVRVIVRSDSPGLGSFYDHTDEGRALRDRLATIQGVLTWTTASEQRGWDDDDHTALVWDVSLTIPADPVPRAPVAA